MFRNLPTVILLSLNLLTLAVHAATWDLWISKDVADPDFYGMSHYILEIFPAGEKTNGILLDAALNNDGLTYRKRRKDDYDRLVPSAGIIKGITDAQKNAVLAAYAAEPAPDPTANPHRNCQDFVAGVISRSGLTIEAKYQKLYKVQENLKPDNSAANVGTQTTAGKYFAHTNNFQSGDAVKKWTFTGAANAKRSVETIQRRTPVHFKEGVKSKPLAPAGKCPTGQTQRTRVDPRTKKIVPLTKIDPKTKKRVPDCAPATPVKKPVQPVKKPVQPVKKPVQPVKKPVKPVKKPVTRPRPGRKGKAGRRV